MWHCNAWHINCPRFHYNIYGILTNFLDNGVAPCRAECLLEYTQCLEYGHKLRRFRFTKDDNVMDKLVVRR